MSDFGAIAAEVESLCCELFEETIDESKLRRLEKLVQEEPEAKQIYVEYINLHAALGHYMAPTLPPEMDPSGGSLPSGEELSLHTIRELYLQYLSRCGKMQQKDGDFDKIRESFLASIEGQAEPSSYNSSIFPLLEIEKDLLSSCYETDGLGSNGPGVSKEGGSSSFVPGLIMAMTSLLILSVVIILPIYWSMRTDDSAWTIAAQVSQTSDCEWKKGSDEFTPGSFLVADQVLDLKQGVVELRFCSGAKVILQGPVRFKIAGQNAGQLDFGRLAATVIERAKGFTVKTPVMNVVDLGTEFGLFVDTEGDSDVHVFKGEVQIKFRDEARAKNVKITKESQEKLLTKDQAIHFEAQSGTVEKRPANPNHFVRRMKPLEQPLDYTIENHTLLPGSRDFFFFQSRAAILPYAPGQLPEIMIITQKLRTQSHDYHDLFQVNSTDWGYTWSEPKVIASLEREKINGQKNEQVIGDFYPKLHQRSGVVLGTGKVFTYPRGKSGSEKDQVSYSVYDADTDRWNGLNVMAMPERDHRGAEIMEPNAACTQRVDLPDGDILLPIRYRRGGSSKESYVSTVARCGFDGSKLTYKEHGSEITIGEGRGLLEPSLAVYNDQYYLTLRADKTAYVTRGTDGLNFEPVREWTFDDGQPLGSYNTQQHWVTHSDGLFLVYTRKGADNDHVQWHRAPLFIAQVDPERLCVIRSTERVLIPEEKATLGNFGVLNVTPLESWIVAAEYPGGGRNPASGKTIIAKLYWSKPNKVMWPSSETVATETDQPESELVRSK